ncbi:uncharacterized protein L201_004144 [Kwoniella dendrophila CBS 6074]|uniref:MICOS complex subunit n=1 Tax=Kwoniella dendrophila CBS 6074 TaxID=1295534 RepID=A0AAX4JVF4_9TREE
MASAEGSVRPGRSISGEKLPIYPTAESNPLITLIEKPNPLVPYIAQSREAVTGVLKDARGYLQSGVGNWIGFERRVESEVKSILPADESLNPGLIYVLIAGLSGSVLTRTRSLPIRFISPPLFTLLASPYFLPKTSHNIRKYLSDFEDENFPDFAKKHDHFIQTGLAHTQMTINKIKDYKDDVKDFSSKQLENLENQTGLQLNQNVISSKIHNELSKLQNKNNSTISSTTPNNTISPEKSPLPTTQTTTEYERIGYVVEQKPVAEVVVPVKTEEKKLV